MSTHKLACFYLDFICFFWYIILKMIKIIFCGITYTQKQQLSLIEAVDQYSLKIACKFISIYGLPYCIKDDLRQEFELLFFEKIAIKKDIKCDYATFFYKSCANKLKDILRSKKKRERYNLIDNEFADVYAIETGLKI